MSAMAESAISKGTFMVGPAHVASYWVFGAGRLIQTVWCRVRTANKVVGMWPRFSSMGAGTKSDPTHIKIADLTLSGLRPALVRGAPASPCHSLLL
ncbi:hypothetical protein BGW80DRAFT_445576 [Lactifluus volemus]|nr:hypothetical protein BGW80DRAFT_445576 [Lactifluus volemus]